MSDSRVEVSISADASGLEAALAQATQALQGAFSSMGTSAQSLNGLLETVVQGIAALQPSAANARTSLEDLGRSSAAQMRAFNRELQAGTQHLRLLAQTHEITASDEAQAEIDLTNKLFEEEQARLNLQALAAAQDENAFRAVLERKRALQQKWADDIQRINDRATLATTRQWQGILQPIESGFDTMFRNMLTGSRSFQQSLAQITGNMVTSFVSARLKIEFEWLAGQLAMALGAQKWAEASLLSWLAAQLGIKTAQTTSDAAVIASKSAAALASSAITVGQGTGEILAAAAVAAANAYAATAAIPVVGPELAPAAAATAYTATAAWAGALEAGANIAGGAPGLAVGAWEIPATMLAVLHAGESVVPADFASGLRGSGILGKDGAAGSGDVYSITIQAIDTQTGAQFLKNNMGTIVAGLARQRRNLNAAFNG